MVFLIETFSCTESGPVFAHEIAKAFSVNGVEVYAILHANVENRKDWEKDFQRDHLYFWEGSRGKGSFLDTIRNIINIRKLFLHSAVDYILYTNPTRFDIFLSKFIKHKETIAILHDVIPHSSTNNKLSDYTKATVAKADNIMVLTKKYIDIVQKEYGIPQNRILYMRHGLMTYPQYLGEMNCNLEDSKIINFLYFGRIDGYKGLHVLASAYKGLTGKGYNISLTVAGGGDFTEYANEYADLKNATVLNRYIDENEIAYLFSRPRTVVVLPYLDATQSGVIGIAYNYLTPIIATDTGGIKEQLFDGKAGILAKPGDQNDLAAKMEQFILNRDLLDDQKKILIETKKKMSWDYITKELLDQLNSK